MKLQSILFKIIDTEKVVYGQMYHASNPILATISDNSLKFKIKCAFS